MAVGLVLLLWVFVGSREKQGGILFETGLC